MTSFRTAQEIHDLVYGKYNDFPLYIAGEEEPAVLYADKGHTEVWTDRVYTFDTWEDMMKAPVFYGRTLEEVVPLMTFYP